MDIPIAKKYSKKLIASHPDYPSMLSIGDTLERLGIRYKAARIEKEYIDKVKYPYLLLPDEGGREPRIVRDRQDLTANGRQDSGNKETGEEAIVMKAEPTDTIADEENNRQRLQDRFFRILTSVLVVAVAGLILLNILPSLTWVYTSLLLTALAGAVVGYLLIAKDVGISYEPVENFCRAGKKTNCDAVLQSEAAQLFGKATLSDLVATYFIFQLVILGLLIPFVQTAVAFWEVLMGLSILTIPIIGYSLYYQFFKIKTWCRLCLAVDIVLALQAVLFGTLYFENILQLNDIHPEIRANRIKNTPSVFLHLLIQQRQLNIPSGEMDLRIGKSDAPITLLMVGSLGCGPCKEGFEKAAQLVQSYPLKVCLRIRFFLSGTHNGAVTPDRYLLHYWEKKMSRFVRKNCYRRGIILWIWSSSRRSIR